MTEPTSSAAAPAPLTPPEGAPLTLTAAAPPPPVAATQAPAMAPQVYPALVPELDSKVDGYMSALMAAQTRSPEFTKQAADVRAMDVKPGQKEPIYYELCPFLPCFASGLRYSCDRA